MDVVQWLTMGGRKGWIMEKPAIVERICYIWRKPHFHIAIFGDNSEYFQSPL